VGGQRVRAGEESGVNKVKTPEFYWLYNS